LAKQHGRITEAGARIAGISVDGVGRNAAMVEKLALPFPLLSDPDGTRAIKPYGAWHEGKKMARPAVVITTPSGGAALHQVGEDFADRPDEDELVKAIGELGLPPVQQAPPARGHPVPGENAVNPRSLRPYFSGAKMAVTALSGRVGEARQHAEQMTAEYDRFLDALAWLREQQG
jgi:hypothetical protein